MNDTHRRVTGSLFCRRDSQLDTRTFRDYRKAKASRSALNLR